MDAVTETWRAQSLNAVLWIALVVAFPAVLMATTGWPTPFSPPMRVSAMLLYLFVAATAVLRRVGTPWRAWAFLLILYVMAALQLYRAGMAGNGRIVLLAIPLYALLLAGLRSGWVALVLGTLLYGAFIGLSAWGPLAEHLEVRENPPEPGYWIVQGVLLLGGAVPLLVLLSRFRVLHIRAVEAEYRTSAQFRGEIVKRTAAYEALDRAAREHRRLEEEITRAGEEERRRLGSELHDGLCQQLTAALLQCVAIENQHSSMQPPAANPVRALRCLLEDSIGVAYDVARGLCPLDLGADSLGSALESLAKRTRAAADVECEFQNEEETSMSDEQTSLHLYRIAQEAIANALKHARPQRIVVTLRGTPTLLLLQIEDDGCGMPLIPGRSGGMGLNVMAYRAGILGGKLAVEPVSGGGTRIVCRVPRVPSGAGALHRDGGPQDQPGSFPAPQQDPLHGR